METFGTEDELRGFLAKINPVYSTYSGPLFKAGVNQSRIIGNAHVATLTSLDIPELHATDLIAMCKATGSSPETHTLENILHAVREEIRLSLGSKQPQTLKRGFSEVSHSIADRLLESAGFQVVDGWTTDDFKEELSGLANVEAFDYSQFASENAGTPELIKYHQKNLEKFGIRFGRDSFAMVDLHTQKATYTLKTADLELTGGVDAGVIPYGVARAYAGTVLRIGFEHKQSAEAKEIYLLHSKASIQVPKASCLPLMNNRPQAICALLAAHCAAMLPLDIDLTDGQVHHLLRLRGDEVLIFEDCTPAQAYHMMATQLKRDLPLKIKRRRLSAPPPELDEAQRTSFKLLDSLVPHNTLGQQMQDLMDFAPTLDEKMALALDFIQGHVRGGGDLKMPDCVRNFYA